MITFSVRRLADRLRALHAGVHRVISTRVGVGQSDQVRNTHSVALQLQQCQQEKFKVVITATGAPSFGDVVTLAASREYI